MTTIPLSLKTLLQGQHKFIQEQGFDVIGIASPSQKLLEVEAIDGIQTVPLNLYRRISLLKDLLSLYRFFIVCIIKCPKIVHSHTPKAGIVGMMGAWLARVPIRMHTVAGLPLMEATGFKRKLLLFVEKMTYRFSTMVYPNSKGLYDFILENKLTKKEKLKIIANGSSNGIDTAHFSIDQVSGNAEYSEESTPPVPGESTPVIDSYFAHFVPLVFQS